MLKTRRTDRLGAWHGWTQKQTRGWRLRGWTGLSRPEFLVSGDPALFGCWWKTEEATGVFFQLNAYR